MISYKVIGQEMELDKSVLKEYRQIRRKIFSFANILSRIDVR